MLVLHNMAVRNQFTSFAPSHDIGVLGRQSQIQMCVPDMHRHVATLASWATKAVSAVVRFLIAAGRLPQGYDGGPRNMLRRPPLLLGRSAIVAEVQHLLKQSQLVMVVGGPGEGKSALAAEVAHHLWESGRVPGGAYAIDLALAPTEGASSEGIC